MRPRSRSLSSRSVLALALGAVAISAAAAAAPLHAQDAPVDEAHRRAAGCYRFVPASDEPWLVGLERRIELTLDPLPGLGVGTPRVARAADGVASGYGSFSWSLFAGGEVVQLLWSGEADQVSLTFEPGPDPGPDGFPATAAFFTHDPDRTAPPVTARVIPTPC